MPTSDETIRKVQMRFRICAYLFRASFAWLVVGFLGMALLEENNQDGSPFTVVIAIGFALFTAAFAVTLAIYRCPVCDTYISRFRKQKDLCGACGARIRRSSTSHPLERLSTEVNPSSKS